MNEMKVIESGNVVTFIKKELDEKKIVFEEKRVA